MSRATEFALQCPASSSDCETIELAHGGGGLMTRRLIDSLFRPAFSATSADFIHDGAVLDIHPLRLAFTTDSYVVKPLFFPGGDIGTLAVNGTVNDLAMCGAEPLYLSVGLVLEEGFSLASLRRIVASMGKAAAAACVKLVTGDTKVVERGKGDGLYVNTSGIGRLINSTPIGPGEVRAGDVVIVSGDIGRHGIAIMAARESLGFETDILSDCAALFEPIRSLITAGIEVHCLRDLTRGGLATALIEIAEAGHMEMRLEHSAITIADPVQGACEILGLDPLYVANEGRFVAIVPERDAEQTVATLAQFNEHVANIGNVLSTTGSPGVHLGTIGGQRTLDLLSGEQLPRIC